MRLSPCLDCIFKDFPKDLCIKDCEAIKAVQKKYNAEKDSICSYLDDGMDNDTNGYAVSVWSDSW